MRPLGSAIEESAQALWWRLAGRSSCRDHRSRYLCVSSAGGVDDAIVLNPFMRCGRLQEEQSFQL
jgi:hypothetical protein